MRTKLLALIGLLYLIPTTAPAGDEVYSFGPDSLRKEGVPRGKITNHVWRSEVFPGTIRHYSVYAPAQYDGKSAAAVMVFQDGHAYLGEEGQFRAPVVLDNLIHAGDMPVTIGIFIDPGHKKSELPPKRGWRPTPENRSFEYDTLSDQYARFLLEEILPEVGKTFKLSNNPDERAICGISSGGICAWTVAWQRPDAFRKVLSHVGSFTNIRGGHNYPAIIRKTDPKPIRVFLQGGTGDLNNSHGNWFVSNQQMASALAFRNYDLKVAFGEGGHNGKHGGAILPSSMRWLWRDSPVRKRGAELKLLSDGFKFTEGPAADRHGNVFFTDQPNDRIMKWSVDGKLSTFLQPSGRANGLYFDASGNLLACADEKNELWTINPSGKVDKIVRSFGRKKLNGPNDLWIAPDGGLYFTDPFYKRPYWENTAKEQDGEHLYYVSPDRRTLRRAATGFKRPNGLIGTPDGETLYVTDLGDRKTYSYSIGANGELSDRRLFAKMGSDGMTIDDEGNVYLTGRGVTVFNSSGEKIDQIPVPEGWTANVCFGGAGLDTLFITAMDSLYAIPMRTRGVRSVAPAPSPRA
ncbi:MAG: SMP-30/gluconolactonase/LRE family protein, partial [Planctomycetota bacterium]